jgi:hypothetical protein
MRLWGALERASGVPHRRGSRGAREGELGLSMTSRYAGRESVEAKAACVRAVKLPK